MHVTLQISVAVQEVLLKNKINILVCGEKKTNILYNLNPEPCFIFPQSDLHLKTVLTECDTHLHIYKEKQQF